MVDTPAPDRRHDSTLAPLPAGPVAARAWTGAHDGPPHLVACHDCDLLIELPPLADRAAARCPRCQYVIARGAHETIERTVALTVAALILFVAANAFPLLTMRASGNETEATILSGSRILWDQDNGGLAALVLLTTFVAPLAHALAMLYVLVPLGFGLRAPAAADVFRWMGHVRVWSMAEVFVLGVLVSLVKLADMAEIVPGIALWALGLLIPTLTAAMATLDPDEVWDRLDRSVEMDADPVEAPRAPEAVRPDGEAAP
jgi:paraquat-inducible protein A